MIPRWMSLNVAAGALLEQIKERESERTLTRIGSRRYADFLLLRNEALFHDTQFTGLDLPSNLEATRRAAGPRWNCSPPRLGRFLGAGDRCRPACPTANGRGCGRLL